MRPLEVLSLYLVIGVTVGLARAVVRAREGDAGGWALALEGLGAALFWPVFLPFLLQPAGDATGRGPASVAATGLRRTEAGPLMAALRRTAHLLDGAMNGLKSREVLGLAPVLTRLPEVLASLEAQARSVEDMEQVLAGEDTEDATAIPELASRREEWVRRLRRLHELRRGELMRAMARLEELVSMVHLARFAQDPASGTGTLVQQISATVESLSELALDEAVEDAAERELEYEAFAVLQREARGVTPR